MIKRSFFVVFIVMFIVISPINASSAKSKPVVKGVSTMSLSIGEYRFTLFGYTSPQAQVTIEGMGVYDQTYAKDNGYFEFKNRFSPFSPREACLTAKDQLGRTSHPVCLPPFPTDYNVSIGPIILSPTISLDKSNYFMGDEVVLSGQTAPNTQVNLWMFTKENKGCAKNGDSSLCHAWLPNPSINNALTSLMHRREDAFERISNLFAFIKPVEAFTFPELQTTSDNKGNFSISLPSSKAKTYRLFAQANFKKDTSPKSNTLNLEVLPVWMIIVKLFLLIFTLLKPHVFIITICIEIGIVLWYLFRRFFHPHTITRYRALALRNTMELFVEEKAIIQSSHAPFA